MSESSEKKSKRRLIPREFLRTILMLDDTPHSIALGTAIGMFIGMTPTVGIQMGLVLIFAFLVRPLFSFNKVAAVLTVYISNPFTVAPIYWGCYKLGTVFVEGNVTYEDFAAEFSKDGSEASRSVFAANLAAIHAHNAKGSEVSWSEGVNRFTAMAPEEFSRYKGKVFAGVVC